MIQDIMGSLNRRTAESFRNQGVVVGRGNIPPPGGMTRRSMPDMTRQFSNILGAYASRGAREAIPDDRVGRPIRGFFFPNADRPVREMTPEQRERAAYDLAAFAPGAGSVTDYKRTGEELGFGSVWANVAAGGMALDVTPGNMLAGPFIAAAIRGTARQSPTAKALQESVPYDLSYNGQTRTMDRRTYEAVRALHPDRLPEAEQIFDDEVVLPKSIKPDQVRGALRALTGGYKGTPTTRQQVDNTARDGLNRVQETYAASGDYSTILSKYGVTAPTVTVPKIRPKELKKMQETYETDMGPAWSFDPITGDIITTNNEHVFSVSSEALRHVFELKQLDIELDASKLSNKQKKAAVQRLLDQQARELRVVLDPNEAMIILTARANQDVVKSMDPEEKIPALLSQVGGRFFPIPRREGEVFGVAAPLGATAGAYMDVIEAVGTRQPSLVSPQAKQFRSRYNDTIKPIRDRMRNVTDPEKLRQLEEELVEAEMLLARELGYI
jgi:hypothetical protein